MVLSCDYRASLTRDAGVCQINGARGNRNDGRTMQRRIEVDVPFSLADTCAPVAWAAGRWANQDWTDGELLWVGWENDHVVHRIVRSESGGRELSIQGDADPACDLDWAACVLGAERSMPRMTDPVLAGIAERHPGLHPHASGSLFDGVIDSIVGQSITVLAAAVVSARLASYFHPGVELQGRIFWPPPRPVALAHADPSRLRATGVTWKRAEALVSAGRASMEGRLVEPAAESLDQLRSMLLALPLIGKWTAESALLWGIGVDDAFPSGDVALLRAARRAYAEPDMTMRELDTRSETWAGYRAWAARLLWIDLFGPASSPRYSTR
jgi:3-methyladenine DNA glycosylase/8-oxoguanine DNA glycosylase